jgi:hypothetical protein
LRLFHLQDFGGGDIQMKRLYGLMGMAVLVAGCTSPAPAPAPAPAAPAAQPYANLAQVMRGIPFPNSNIIFDTQSLDPAALKKPGEQGVGASAQYNSVYGGWQAVENAALAIQETANLITIPGRMCENGKPVPLNDEVYKKAAAGLVDAGKVAYKAAQSKNLDAMLEAGGTVTDACAACHEVYRDKDDNKDRCTPQAAAAAK